MSLKGPKALTQREGCGVGVRLAFRLTFSWARLEHHLKPKQGLFVERRLPLQDIEFWEGSRDEKREDTQTIMKSTNLNWVLDGVFIFKNF